MNSNSLNNIARDSDGYLMHFDVWTPEIATAIALEENINLTDQHWEIINLLRDFYSTYQTAPIMRVLIKEINNKLDANKANSIFLHQLFPQGPTKQANKIAGLPKPVRCI